MRKIKDTNYVLPVNQSPLSCLVEWSCIMELSYFVGFLTEVSIIIISVINPTCMNIGISTNQLGLILAIMGMYTLYRSLSFFSTKRTLHYSD